MKFLIVLAAVVGVACGEPPSSYGAPAILRNGDYRTSPPVVGGFGEQEQYQRQVFKHVYVHVAPDEPADAQARTIRVPGGDKHVNIIFVKAPSSSSSQQTEVILPEQDEHKNLVYVLLKKGEASSDVKIRRPAAPSPQKPDVYFIRYKDQQTGAVTGTYGPPAPYPLTRPDPVPTPVKTINPYTSYGAPGNVN